MPKSLLFLILALTAQQAFAGLERYRHLVVSDSPRTTKTAAAAPSSARPARPKTGVRVTYLGTHAYLLESAQTTVLIDPYFSRMSLLRTGLNLRATSEPARIQQWLGNRQIDLILATHGHIDHLLDVPAFMQRTNAKLIASPTSLQLVASFGIPAKRCLPATGGEVFTVGDATVRAIAVEHDRILGFVPFDGPVCRLPPRQVGDWVCGQPLAFLIEMGGRRIYLESGGLPSCAHPRPSSSSSSSDGQLFEDEGRGRGNSRRIDLAILGVALPDSRARFPTTLKTLRPRFVLPSHQDNFFRPLSRGFTFGPLTNFPQVERSFAAAHVPSRLILLDYFQPWTLP